MAQQTATHIGRVTTVAVPVSDADRALDFYVGTLGLEKRADAPFGGGNRWMEVAAAGAATTIALVYAPSGDVRPGVDTGIRLATSDCEADHRTLAEHGTDVDEILHWPGVPPMFSFRDPDGNTLYMIEA